jgi:PadR family transcriptional regulator PadR
LALAQRRTTWGYGYELCQQLGIKAGSMYTILMRLADRGLVETAWETDAPPGRPARHLYRLSRDGQVLAASLSFAVQDATTRARIETRPGWQPG